MTGMYRAAFSPDGKRLAVAESGAGGLRLWDVGSGEHRELKGNTDGPDSLAFSADGKLLAGADRSGVSCWDAATGEQLWRAKADAAFVAFTADGRVLIASPYPRGRVWHCWDAATGKTAEGLKLPEGYGYSRLAVAPNGRTLVFDPRGLLGADWRVHLWDMQSGKLLRILPTAGMIGPFFRDGRSVLINDGALQRWELATGRPLLPDTDALGHRTDVSRAVYSPDGRRLASAADDGTIRVWEVATAKPLRVLPGHEHWGATGLAFTPDGKFLVSGGVEGELHVWDVEAGREVRRILLHDARAGEQKQHVWKLHVTPDGRTVFVLGYDPEQFGNGRPEGIVTSWDLATGKRKTLARSPEARDGFYSGFSPDGRLLASCGLLLDTHTCKPRTRLEPAPEYLGCYAFSPDGRLVAGLITRHETDGVRHRTKMVGIQLWESASGAAVRRIPTDWVAQPVFSPDGRYLAAADLDCIRLWELATGDVIMRHKAHERVQGFFGYSFASCLVFAPDGRTLATGHPDSTVLVWSLAPAGRRPAAEMARLWKDLAGPDAAAAYAASWRLAEAPGPALLLLRQHVRPLKPAAVEQTRPLLADLDSDDFDRREAASARLRQLGERAEEALRQALAARPSPEKRRRLEGLLKALEQPSGGALGELRAVAVLERLGTTESRELLRELGEGDPRARLTREAKASLERLARRPAVPPPGGVSPSRD
jgi:WD40 repeat protein